MRHPTVLTSWLNFSIVHGTFCFSHSIITNLACQIDDFLLLLSKGQLCKFRLSKFCFQHPSSCIRLRSTSFLVQFLTSPLSPHPHIGTIWGWVDKGEVRNWTTSFRNPLREDIAGAANLHPYPHGKCGNEPSSDPPVEWSRENDLTLRRSHVCLFNMAVPASQT